MRLRTSIASTKKNTFAQRLYRNKMFERQILGIRIGGFDGADSNFGENWMKHL